MLSGIKPDPRRGGFAEGHGWFFWGGRRGRMLSGVKPDPRGGALGTGGEAWRNEEWDFGEVG